MIVKCIARAQNGHVQEFYIHIGRRLVNPVEVVARSSLLVLLRVEMLALYINGFRVGPEIFLHTQ